jgi:nicotinamidase-related amidase
MVALLIIDMQKGMFSAETPRYDYITVIERINHIAENVRKKKGKVIFIQHDGNNGEQYEPGTNDWQLIDQLKRIEGDKVVHKTACDAFYHTELEEYLHRNHIETIIITGCATDYCVDTTIRIGTSKEYYILVAKDAHTTSDRPFLTAEQVIQHHNWVWENLILPKHNIRVLSTEEVIILLKDKQI